ncbi:hypothetical protein PMAYCL1PPCAC_08035 [Pristionchus mayeri]|uniref:Secreted protein n=1 Tax=Pristionchus mayeri TaxID=1317129 RepID=A0AAN4ZHL6_9BILA|nr:hypothetical protein PMAYCL1PPCAC_08035 [Pristionchus mayeri]
MWAFSAMALSSALPGSKASKVPVAINSLAGIPNRSNFAVLLASDWSRSITPSSVSFRLGYGGTLVASIARTSPMNSSTPCVTFRSGSAHIIIDASRNDKRILSMQLPFK